jgi:hypothetical protein
MEDYDHHIYEYKKDNIEDIDIFDSPNIFEQGEYYKPKRQIFQISNYNFLKKKRESIKETIDKKKPWTMDEVYIYF